MANPPPAPARKKSGPGCCGCGCVILILLVVLALGLIGGGTYLLYHSLYGLTSSTATNIPTFDGGDDVYNGAVQKIAAFNQDLQQNQPTTLNLSADEMNTFIARNPNIALYKVRLFMATTDDQAHVQACVPLDFLPYDLYKGRFLNVDATFSFNLDPDSHSVHLILHSVKIGAQAMPENELPLLQQEFDPILNAELQKSPYFKNLLNHAKTVEIKDGTLDVETE